MTNVMTVGRNILLLFWFAVLVSAQPRKGCSAPPVYEHAKPQERFSTRQWFNNEAKVYYDCDGEYTRSGGFHGVRCLNGRWSRLKLKCQKISCGPAQELANGQMHYEGNFYIGERVRAECNKGYTLKGSPYLTCQKTGWSGDFPSCEVGETTCPHPAVANSVQTGGEVPAYRVGDKATVTCRQGFQLVGAQQVTCGSDGQWQPQPPQCQPLPEDKTEQPPINERPSTTKQPHVTEWSSTTEQPPMKDGRCRPPQPASGSNAKLTDMYITKTSFASGDVVKFECQVGYTGIGGNRYRSCKNGRWTQQYLECKPKSCGSAGEINHGEFIYSGSVFGDTATAVCDEGYRLVGRATRNCMDGGWDGRIPACEAVECDDPLATNAEMLDVRDFYTYSTVVRYRCGLGTLVGQQSIWCTKDGTWSSPPPKCQVMTCPPPNVPNAYWMPPRNLQYQYKETISIACNWGYTMAGSNFITCDSDGQWSPPLPRCSPSYNPNNNWYY